ncbi:hypothetical protein M3223_19075 [Paenibacillus pasadenensis]|uniref:hypothetical protein n=1 Tax=Paenibacillus pasadenensis TaxID=217090 RepID=UPI00203DA615|nr:hypothetical protein [Paenibacillus pasadenensis]MCM3749458.1 hypothetical protein [Paenibacillus pasadenensis]
MTDWPKKKERLRWRSLEGLVYCLDSGRLHPADDSHYVFKTGFRTCDGINYPVAVKRSSFRGPYLTLSS